MLLAWAHAEYLKVLRSLADARVFDTPPQSQERYNFAGITSPYPTWRFNHKCRSFPESRILRIEATAAAVVHWSIDGWKTVHDTPSRDSGFGMHFVDIPTADAGPEIWLCSRSFGSMLGAGMASIITPGLLDRAGEEGNEAARAPFLQQGRRDPS